MFLRLIPCYCKKPSIFSRLGAWQFLADMPFRSVSSETLWKLFLVLHLDASKVDSVESIQRENAYKDNWRDILKSMFNNRSNKLWATVFASWLFPLDSGNVLKEVRKIIEHFQFALKCHSPTLCRRFCLLCRSSPTLFLRAILEMIRSRQPCFRCKGSVVLLIFRNGHVQNILIFLFSVGTFSILSLR